MIIGLRATIKCNSWFTCMAGFVRSKYHEDILGQRARIGADFFAIPNNAGLAERKRLLNFFLFVL